MALRTVFRRVAVKIVLPYVVLAYGMVFALAWAVFKVFELAPAYAAPAWDEVRVQITILSASVTFVMLIVGLISARRIARPIRDIERVCLAVQSGRMDRRVTITTRDELATIATTLNSLLDQLSGETRPDALRAGD